MTVRAGSASQIWKTATLLAVILLHNLTYPISASAGIWPLVFYLFYASIFVFGTIALTDDPGLRVLAGVSGLAVFVAGVWNSYSPGDMAALGVFITSLIYHVIMGFVLARYVFRSDSVMTDIVLAATSLYLVIGSGYATVFAIIEWLQPGSFAVSSGADLGWQQMVYYSFVTLTTVGYGDITPIGFYAQAFAAFEAVLGVLYTVVLLSRLVGMHASRAG